MKTLMEARPPHGRLNLKNVRQVVTNALFFSLMTVFGYGAPERAHETGRAS